MSKTKNKNIFDEFTGLYEVQKTLKFELKPLPTTRRYLELDDENKKKIFSEDKKRAENYQIIKKYIDKLHGRFISEALKSLEFEVKDYLGKRKDKRKTKSDEKKLRGKVREAFNNLSKADEFKGWVTVSNKGEVKGKLFEKELIDILRDEFPKKLDNEIEVPKLFFNHHEGEKSRKLREVFNSFKTEKDQDGKKKGGQDFTTYFTDSFHNNRKNYYRVDGKAGRVATRIVNENLKRFCDNAIKFEEMEEWNKENEEQLFNLFQRGWQEYINEKSLQNEEYLNGFSLGDWKQVFGSEYKYLLQKDIDLYNFITRKLNGDINKSKYKGRKFLKLHKQIHGEVGKKREEIEINEDNILEKIKEFVEHSQKKVKESELILKQLTDDTLDDLENIYFSKRAIETLSSKFFVAWHTFGGKIEGKSKSKQRKKLPDFIDIQSVKDSLDKQESIPFKELFKNRDEIYKELQEGKHWDNFLHVLHNEFQSLVKQHKEKAEELKKETEYKKNSEEQVELIQEFANITQAIFRMTNYLALRKKGVSKEISNSHVIHDEVEKYLDGDEVEDVEPCLINKYYNALRNFVTKKPWIEEKIRLNFDCGNLLSGWAQSYEKYGGLIFQKQVKNNTDPLYYLGILRTALNNKEIRALQNTGSEEKMDRIVYKFQKMDFKNFPRMFINSTTNKETDEPVKSPFFQEFEENNPEKAEFIWAVYQDYKKCNSKQKKDDFLEENPDFRNNLIDYFKKCVPLHESLKTFKDNFVWKDTKEYKTLSEFYDDTGKACYKLLTESINEAGLKKLVDNDKLYLFQIYNKDFELDPRIGKQIYGENFKSKAEWRKEKGLKKGKENRDTTFFKLLFEPKNLENESGVVYKLSGGAKVFYRPASRELKTKDITTSDGKLIIERKRYAEGKCFLHVPIVCNFSNKNEGYRVNEKINDAIGNTPFGKDKFRIIALDRGEKHLAYLSILNEEGKILDLRSLNYINRYDNDGNIILEKNTYYNKEGKEVETKKEPFKDYHSLLDKKEVERIKSRKSWQRIEQIKDLKAGYLSMLVNEIVRSTVQAIEENKIPIIILEDLNLTQARAHIEKQIYQRLEIKLVEKFKYLVRKETDNFLNAWQLVPKWVDTFADIRKSKQLGIMLYVNPGYTSSTCPQCGFRKRKYIQTEKAQKEFENVDITFDGSRYVFKYLADGGVTPEEVYSDVRRIYWNNHADNKRGKLETMDSVTEELSKLFKEFGVIYKGKNINKQIQEKEFETSTRKKEFWSRLNKYFRLILQVRNSINRQGSLNEKTGEIEGREQKDFIQCPACYFDSESKEKWDKLKNKLYIGNDKEVEFNGDANGALNIGRKGLILLKKLKEHETEIRKFLKRWGLNREDLPNENTQYTFEQEGIGLLVKVRKEKIEDKKEIPIYCVLEDQKQKIEDLPKDRKLQKSPDLFISNECWDEFLEKNVKS